MEKIHPEFRMSSIPILPMNVDLIFYFNNRFKQLTTIGASNLKERDEIFYSVIYKS